MTPQVRRWLQRSLSIIPDLASQASARIIAERKLSMIIVTCAGLDWRELNNGMQSVWRWQELESIKNWAQAVRERLHADVDIVTVSEHPALWALLVPEQTARTLVSLERRPWFGRFTFQPDRNVYGGLAADGKLVRCGADRFREVADECERYGIFLTPDWVLAQRRSFYAVLV